MATYGRGVVSLDVELHDTTELKDRLLCLFRAPDYRPPVLPRVALELLELTRKADVQVGQIAHLLEQDPLIAAAVLRRAQSAFYSRGATLRSLHDAIVRLGLHAVSDVFLEVSLSARIFRAQGYDEPMDRLRRHSTATAYVARLVCRHTSIFDEYAFLCGLLHDAGMVAGLIAFSSPGAAGTRPPDFERVWPAICEAHPEAGAMLCDLWKLPADVGYVIGTHHTPRAGNPVHPLAAAVRVAESIASGLGFGIDENDAGEGWAIRALGLTAPLHASVVRDAVVLLRGIG